MAGLSWALPVCFVRETNRSMHSEILRSHGHCPLNIWSCPLCEHLRACNFCAIYIFLWILLGVRVPAFCGLADCGDEISACEMESAYML